MTDLTEQWKKGELPAGYYYVKNEFNNIFPSDYSESYDSINDAVIKDFFTEVSEITEVLAPVPSYEEWKEKIEENARLKKQINHVLRTQARQFVDNQKLQAKAEKAKDVVNFDMARRIIQLKELLKECSPYVGHSATSRMIKNSVGFKKDMKLLTKIDEVLK